MIEPRLVRGALVAAALTLAPLGASHASAQPGTATGTSAAASQPAVAPPKRSLPPGFEPVAGKAAGEQLDPNPLVAGAYAMFFVVMFGYLIHVVRGQSALAAEMAELSERIRKAEKR